jgi:hypothetical protein
MRVSPTVYKPSAGCCIYCRRDDVELRDEHVMPLSLGGSMVIRMASCLDCAGETHAIEGHCAGQMFKALRAHQGFPTRRPKKRPTHLEILEGTTPHGAPMRLIPVSDAPGAFDLPEFEPPGILLGREPLSTLRIIRHNIYTTTADASVRQKNLVSSGLQGAYACCFGR